MGAQVASSGPSALDCVLASSGAIDSSAIVWRGAPADHAFVTASLSVGSPRISRHRLWRPPEAVEWQTVPGDLLREAEGERGSISLAEAGEGIPEFQRQHKDMRSARMRRRDRVCPACREHWGLAAAAANEGERRAHVSCARRLLMEAVEG